MNNARGKIHRSGRLPARFFAGFLIPLISACSVLSPAAGAPETAPAPMDIPPAATWEGQPADLPSFVVGDLSIIDGCPRVIDAEKDINLLLVWSSEYEVLVEADMLEITVAHPADGKAKVRFQNGQTVMFGGREISRLNEAQARSVPASCSGPYWLVGSMSDQQTPAGVTAGP